MSDNAPVLPEPIPADELADMTDRQIEKAAHNRAEGNYMNEDNVAAGMKAMRTQVNDE